MGCVESFPLRFHGTRLTEERESFEIDDIECKKVQWTKVCK